MHARDAVESSSGEAEAVALPIDVPVAGTPQETQRIEIVVIFRRLYAYLGLE
jgi:hypothetical protein